MATQAEAERLRDELLAQLSARATEVERLECYRDGDHPLPQGLTEAASGRKAQEMRQVFKRLLRESRSNWCGLVVDAVDERLAVDGFRFKGEPKVDTEVWGLWQANAMDAESLLVHGTALATGQAFVIVWPGADGEPPMVTAEHPGEVLVAYEAGSSRRRRAAVKRWTEADGSHCVTLYLPDALWKWRSAPERTGFARQWHAGEPQQWVERHVADEPWPLPNPMGVVPVVEYRANPRLKPAPYGGGTSEFAGVIDVQDRINETVFGRMLAMHFSAFRQKWATGISIPTDDNGKPVEPFDSAITKLWATESENVKFGEFGEHSLANYLDAAEADVQHLAAMTHTPPHYLLGKMANLAADSLKSAEANLVSKTRRHMRFLGEAHEETARLMVLAKFGKNDERATDYTLEVVWRDPETRSEAERVDALVKLASIGVPKLALWERIPGVTQTELARWQTLATMEAALTGLASISTNVQQEQPPADVTPADSTPPGG